VKPLLQVTNQEAALTAKEDELRAVKDRLSKRESEFDDVQKKMQQVRLWLFAE
jgi:predicted  nucleic acid-binding Zn-ribbon protein